MPEMSERLASDQPEKREQGETSRLVEMLLSTRQDLASAVSALENRLGDVIREEGPQAVRDDAEQQLVMTPLGRSLAAEVGELQAIVAHLRRLRDRVEL